jgi:hypothetical protein
MVNMKRKKMPPLYPRHPLLQYPHTLLPLLPDPLHRYQQFHFQLQLRLYFRSSPPLSTCHLSILIQKCWTNALFALTS